MGVVPDRFTVTLALERWFDRLVKNKMAGPALCVASIAVGYALIQATRVTPAPYDEGVGYTGLRLLQACACILAVATGFFCLEWVRPRNSGERRR